jgi:molybdopterin converting factor small subunit
MTADERVRMMLGDLMVQLQVAMAEVETLKAENTALKKRDEVSVPPPSGDAGVRKVM